MAIGIGEVGTALQFIKILKSIKTYFNPKILKMKYKFKGKFHEFDFGNDNNVICFWKSILGRNFYLSPTYDGKVDKDIISEKVEKPIKVGDFVEIKNSSISRWAPLLPGQSFSNKIKWIDSEYQQTVNYIEKEDGEMEWFWFRRPNWLVLSGRASFRVLPYNKQYLLSASCFDSSIGLPILIPERMFESKLLDVFNDSHAATANILGTVKEIPGEWNAYLKEKIPTKLHQEYSLPKYIIQVNEIKNIGNPRKVFGFAWTGFKEKGGSGEYSETLVSSIFDITSGDEGLERATKSVLSHREFLESGFVGGNWYPVFNFDEVKNWISGSKYSPSSKAGYIRLKKGQKKLTKKQMKHVENDIFRIIAQEHSRL